MSINTKEEKIKQIEKQALKDALLGNLEKYIDGGIKAEHFSKFKPEWEWIIETEREYGKAPTLDSFGYQFPALEFPEISDATELIIKQLDKEYKFNIVAPGVNDLVRAMREGRTAEGLEAFMALVEKADSKEKKEAINLFAEAENRLKQYEEAISNPQLSKTYGYEEIDRITGGIWRNDLIILAGRPGTGKSLIALESARCLANAGSKVAYFNGEMGEDELGYRLDALESNISNFAISNGIIGKDGHIHESYKKAAPEIARKKAELLVLSRENSKEKITPAYLEKFCKRNAIDILYIDQFSLLDSASKFRETSEIRYELVRELKIVGKRLGIPIVLLAQIKRQDKALARQLKEGEPKFDTSDLSQTRGLEEFGTVVIMIEQIFERDENGYISINLFIAKNRHGEKEHILTYAWNIDKGKRMFVKSNKELPNFGQRKKSGQREITKENTENVDGGLPF